MPVRRAEPADRLIDEVTSWRGISTGEGRFDSTRFLVGRRELGHLHHPVVLDMPLSPVRKRELLERGEVEQHRWTPPNSGWVSVRLDSETAVDRAIALLRERYEHAIGVQERRDAREAASGKV
jgi:hypothetical protein